MDNKDIFMLRNVFTDYIETKGEKELENSN